MFIVWRNPKIGGNPQHDSGQQCGIHVLPPTSQSSIKLRETSSRIFQCDPRHIADVITCAAPTGLSTAARYPSGGVCSFSLGSVDEPDFTGAPSLQIMMVPPTMTISSTMISG